LALNEETDNSSDHGNSSNSIAQTQRTDLQDSFGESFEEEEATATDRLLNRHDRNNNMSDDDEDDDAEIIHIPQQAQPTPRNTGPAVLPVSTDGVFANMSAKPETESNKLDETPPVSLWNND
jgi:hypothetical protein